MIITVEKEGDFYRYCTAKEGLALVYRLCKRNILAKERYDELRAPSDVFSVMEFVPVSMHDIQRTTEMGTEEFRIAMITGSISELSFREYVFHKQKQLLQDIGEYAKIGELALNFVSMCMRLFSYLPNETEHLVGSSWIYKITYKLACYLHDRMLCISVLEMKANVHYAIGLLLSIARSRLERMGQAK